jgi:hypothetical protein
MSNEYNENANCWVWILVPILSLIYYYFYYPNIKRYNNNNNNNNDEIIEQEKGVGGGKSHQAQISSCNNPLCIRCVRYGYLQKNAKSKLSWILWDFKTRSPSKFSSLNQRIPNSIQQHIGSSDGSSRNSNSNSNSNNNNSSSPLLLQDPTVLMVSDLPSKEIITDWHQNTCEYLSQRPTRRIVFDVLQSLCLYGDYDGWGDNDWTENDSPHGQSWKVFHILNQGSWNPILLDEDEHVDNNNDNTACQKNTKLLLDLARNIPGLLDNCIFGNIFISKIYPGTKIESHCGPTNVRHRLQFLLKMPDKSSSSSSSSSELFLSVGNEKISYWDVHRDLFIFDDSFFHSVTYNDHDDETQMIKEEPEQARIVLIIDLWHPNLQDMEKTLLQQLYPPFTTSSDSKKIS